LEFVIVILRSRFSRWLVFASFALPFGLTVAVCSLGCATTEHSVRRDTNYVSVSRFEPIQFVHADKNYCFDLVDRWFVRSGLGIVYRLPEPDVIVPSGELGGPIYRKHEPIAESSRSFSLTDRSSGSEPEYYIDRDEIWGWIRSNYPGARSKPKSTRTFEQVQEAVRSRALHR
jgi:hypothetical protein